MNASSISVLICLLGFVGLVSVGLIPLRSWQALRRAFGNSSTRISQKFLTAFVALAAVSALWVDVRIASRIFKCLTEAYCGPSIASGWIYLAMLGVVYLAFEGIIYLVQRIDRSQVAKSVSSES